MSNRAGTIRATRFGAMAMGAVALGCAAVAAMLVSNILNAHGYTGSRVRPVVVARVNLPAGEPIRDSDLVVLNFPEDSAPAGSFSTVDDLLSTRAGSSPVPAITIVAHEPILASRLATGAAGMVKKEMRAVGVEIDDAAARTGLIHEGAFVDVTATMDNESRVLEGIRVLTVGEPANPQTPGSSQVPSRRRHTTGQTADSRYATLEVSPEQATLIGHAKSGGKLTLSLRNGGDTAAVNPTLVTNKDFANSSTTKPKKCKKPRWRKKGKKRKKPKKIRPKTGTKIR